MTRETKIGLLVGLAFIIVIGILLSDHLTSTTEPAPAPLAQAGENVRKAVTVPGGSTAPSPTVVTSGAVGPRQTVPLKQELEPKRAVAFLEVGAAAGHDAAQQIIAKQPPVTLRSE